MAMDRGDEFGDWVRVRVSKMSRFIRIFHGRCRYQPDKPVYRGRCETRGFDRMKFASAES